MAPILGYTGQASSEELETLRKDNPDYSNDAVVGKAGIEQYMELELQGKTEKKRSQLIILVKSLTLTILKLLILWPETMFI